MRFMSEGGVVVLLEESHDVPLVDVCLILRTGATSDPLQKSGLTRMLARMVRMGTRRRQGKEIESMISGLGGRLSIEVSPSTVALQGTVIQKNVEAFVGLLGDLISRPALRTTDLGYIKRETESDLVAARENDELLAARAFRSTLFSGHPYARSAVGCSQEIRRLSRKDLQNHHASHYVSGNLIIGLGGALDRGEAERLVSEKLSVLPNGVGPQSTVPKTKSRSGRRIVLVDKPGRTQTQMQIGTLGGSIFDEDRFALAIANTAFGGMFSSRLTEEVRGKRGWSYGASSALQLGRRRDAWSMWTHPSSEDLVACARLQLELLESWVERGIKRSEMQFAKNFLINSHCFDVDTADKRLGARIDAELLELPGDAHLQYAKRIRSVRLADCNEAVQRRIDPNNLVIAVVASAPQVIDSLAKLPNVRSVEVVPSESVFE